MDAKTNKASAFMCTVYTEKLVQSGVPMEVAAIVAATKYAPQELEGLASMFAEEQAAIAEHVSSFKRGLDSAEQDSPDTKAPRID